jgi:flagellum-specific peptidoglycan hydrolase FlgJ
MNNIKPLIGTLLAGIIIGFSVARIYTYQKANESVHEAYGIVDFIIADWTGISDEDSIIDPDTSFSAQMSARKELPVARLGFFPDTIRSLALMVQGRYKVPAAVTMAQWALESSWGTNNLGVSNYFGHTYNATMQYSQLRSFVIRTEKIGNKRTLKFTVYKNIAECFDAHGKYLSSSKHYRAAFYTSSPENFARALGIYAEDNEYTTKLIGIMRRYKL